MSSMVCCDRCKKTMYTDSRSEKDAYAIFKEDYIDGYSTFHLCKSCLEQFHVEFMKSYTLEEFNDMFGDDEENEDD